MSALPETIPVREAHRFPTEALDAFLAAQGLGGLKELRQMRGGQSNPTFLVETPEASTSCASSRPASSCPRPTPSTASSGC